jgi:hypothetical protein
MIISYNSSISVNCEISSLTTGSLRAFPVMNSNNQVIGGLVNNPVTIWSKSTEQSVKDESTANVAGSFNPIAYPNDQSGLLDVALSDDTSNPLLKNIPLLLEGLFNGNVVCSVGRIYCNSTARGEIKLPGGVSGLAGDLQWRG